MTRRCLLEKTVGYIPALPYGSVVRHRLWDTYVLGEGDHRPCAFFIIGPELSFMYIYTYIFLSPVVKSVQGLLVRVTQSACGEARVALQVAPMHS